MPRQGETAVRTAQWTAAVLVCGLLALPFFWTLVTALKPLDEVIAAPPRWWPSAVQWSNFTEAWQAAPFGRFYLNSLIAAALGTALQAGLALLMAYAFAFIPFPGKQALLVLVLATLMIPEEMKLIPNYVLLARLGWINTYTALIVPPAAHAFPVFVLYTQLRMLPRDLLDAAAIDGAGHVRTLLQVVVPTSRPVLAAVVLIVFLGRWNDYLWPLVATDSVAMRTLPIGLAYLRQVEEGTPNWHILMAGTLFVIIPVLFVYGLVQRQFVQGITKGALKG